MSLLLTVTLHSFLSIESNPVIQVGLQCCFQRVLFLPCLSRFPIQLAPGFKRHSLLGKIGNKMFSKDLMRHFNDHIPVVCKIVWYGCTPAQLLTHTCFLPRFVFVPSHTSRVGICLLPTCPLTALSRMVF